MSTSGNLQANVPLNQPTPHLPPVFCLPPRLPHSRALPHSSLQPLLRTSACSSLQPPTLGWRLRRRRGTRQRPPRAPQCPLVGWAVGRLGGWAGAGTASAAGCCARGWLALARECGAETARSLERNVALAPDPTFPQPLMHTHLPPACRQGRRRRRRARGGASPAPAGRVCAQPAARRAEKGHHQPARTRGRWVLASCCLAWLACCQHDQPMPPDAGGVAEQSVLSSVPGSQLVAAHGSTHTAPAEAAALVATENFPIPCAPPPTDELLDPLLPLLVRALRSRHAPSVTTALQVRGRQCS